MNMLKEMRLLPQDEPVVMGILNCTPDSFYEDSRKQTEREIALRADEIINEGGRIIDIGAFSTRPGAQEVSEEEELRRMRFALQTVRRGHPDALLSIDTYRPSVARMAVEEYNANIINDVSELGMAFVGSADVAGGTDDAPGYSDMKCNIEWARTIAQLQTSYILMSVQRDMDTMIRNFKEEVTLLRSVGVENIILDPGYGFGKDVIDGNFAVLREQHRLHKAFPELPILAGMSRKRMIWQLLGGTAQDNSALRGTMLANLIALQNGATILRVHDVMEAVETISLFRAMEKGR